MAKNEWVEIVPMRYPRVFNVSPRTGVTVAVYSGKPKKNEACSIRISICADVLAQVRWRAGDKVWFDASPKDPYRLRLKRTDGSYGSRLNKDGKEALQLAITSRAFGTDSGERVPVTAAKVVYVETDAVIIDVPPIAYRAFGMDAKKVAV